jgi:hypothetical protein
MKLFTRFLLLAIVVLSFPSCQKCYECAKNNDTTIICNNRARIKSDLSIYESRGFVCVRKR